MYNTVYIYCDNFFTQECLKRYFYIKYLRRMKLCYTVVCEADNVGYFISRTGIYNYVQF
jgi:hypothetical protein